MDFNQFMSDLATELGGQFSEYDSTKSVIIVPVKDNRFQAVLGVIGEDKHKKAIVEFSSRVCPYKDNIDLKELLEENAKFVYGRFVIIDDFIKVEAATQLESATETQLKEIILEIANLADEWEYKTTGMDVH